MLAWKSKAAVEYVTLEWVSWFNHDRLLASIVDTPPAEAEERFYRPALIIDPTWFVEKSSANGS